jgi:ankyrin repeat protein
MAVNANEVRNMQFYAAVRADDIATVSRLIAEGANIEYVDQSHLRHNSNGRVLIGQFHNTETALGVAAMRGNIDMARVLLEAGARVSRSQLDSAVSRGNLEIARLLLERNPEMARGSYLVLNAITTGNNDLVRLLLEHGADPNARSYGIPAVAKAVHMNQYESVGALIEHGAETNYRNREGMNLFYHALAFNNIDMARLLLMANPGLVDPSDQARIRTLLATNARGAATVAWEKARRNRLSGYGAAAATPAASAGAGSNASANKKGGRRSTRKNLKKNRRH